MSEQAFWARLHTMETSLALREGKRRGWFSYSELTQLVHAIELLSLAQTFITVSFIFTIDISWNRNRILIPYAININIYHIYIFCVVRWWDDLNKCWFTTSRPPFTVLPSSLQHSLSIKPSLVLMEPLIYPT